jgi:hypothetical protein
VSVSDERLAEITTHYGPLCRKRGPNSRNKPSVRRDTYEALRELQALREQVRLYLDREACSFLRNVLSQGMAIQMDAAAGRYQRSEEVSIRLDAAARERRDQMEAALIGPLPGGDA